MKFFSSKTGTDYLTRKGSISKLGLKTFLNGFDCHQRLPGLNTLLKKSEDCADSIPDFNLCPQELNISFNGLNIRHIGVPVTGLFDKLKAFSPQLDELCRYIDKNLADRKL